MAQKLAIGLDDPIFNGRLRMYQKRPISVVKPRGGVTYLRKVAGVDVWLAPEKPKKAPEAADAIFLDKVIGKKQAIIPMTPLPEVTKIPKQEQINYKPDLHKNDRFQGELTRAKTVLSEAEVSEDTLREEKPFAALPAVPAWQAGELLKSGDERAWRKSGLPQNVQADTIAHMPRQKTRRRLGLDKKRIPNLVFAIMAIVLFLFGSGVALQAFLTNKKITAGHVSAQANNVGTAETDQTKPSQIDMASYRVAPDKPRYLRIAKLDVFARVQHLGVNDKNQLKSPYNINDAGWYKDSAVPGNGVGASIVDGHVSGPTQPGVFYGLTRIAIGDEITIERGDGKILTYRVIESKSYPANKLDMSKLLEPKNPAKPGLNLITCTGKINPGTDDYQDRLVVFTEQI